MNRLRVGSISSPFSSRQTEPRDGSLGADNAGPSRARPANNRSQSALLPLQTINTNVEAEAEADDEAMPMSAPGREPGASSARPPMSAAGNRNRSHTVSVAFASGRRSSQQQQSGRGRRRSSVSNPRSLEEGRRSEQSDHAGSGIEFELGNQREDLDDGAVGVLDCIDPEVSTMNHLQNMTNSIIIPHFPALWSRRPEVVIPESPDKEVEPLVQAEQDDQVAPMRETGRRRATTTTSTSGGGGRARSSTVSRLYPSTQPQLQPQMDRLPSFKPVRIPSPDLDADVASIKSDDELDKHVRHILSASKKAKIKRGLRGFWAFVKTPMGAFTAIYGFLCAFWGAAIVLFLLGWIPTSSKDTQDKWVEISSQVTNGLFTVTGVGLIPWRVVDTYRMSVIWTLKRRTERLRIKRGLPPIEDPNDIPDPAQAKDYVSVLTERDQERLRDQQEKFAKSQTWYKPHATETHKAFPMAWALWNTILMDGNSFFQCILCGCMWGLNRHTRPAWTTGSLIPLSFLCGIGAAILIWQGSVRTKKTISVEEKLRTALQLPIAIAIPRTQDGTVVIGHNKAPMPEEVEPSQPPSRVQSRPLGTQDDDTTDESAKGGDETQLERPPSRANVLASPRRTTITIGSTGEKQVAERQRATSIAAPGHEPSMLDQFERDGKPHIESEADKR